MVGRNVFAGRGLALLEVLAIDLLPEQDGGAVDAGQDGVGGVLLLLGLGGGVDIIVVVIIESIGSVVVPPAALGRRDGAAALAERLAALPLPSSRSSCCSCCSCGSSSCISCRLPAGGDDLRIPGLVEGGGDVGGRCRRTVDVGRGQAGGRCGAAIARRRHGRSLLGHCLVLFVYVCPTAY